jgi:hypothetical protein
MAEVFIGHAIFLESLMLPERRDFMPSAATSTTSLTRLHRANPHGKIFS